MAALAGSRVVIEGVDKRKWMQKNTCEMKMKRIYFFPITLAIYPVLSLLATNIAQVELLDALRSLIVSILFACLIYVLLRIWLRDTLRAAVLSTFLLFLFFSYGHVYALIEDFTIFSFNLGRHRYLFAVWLAAAILGVWWVRKSEDSFDRLGQVLNVTSLILIAIPVIQILAFQYDSIESLSEAASGERSEIQINIAENQTLQVAESDTLPDIYYIILDMYTREDVLSSKLAFDNSEFVEHLEDLGFYVVPCANSNYTSTVLSLGATLNLDYFQNIVEIEDKATSPYKFGAIVKENRLVALLEQLGYSVVAFESGFSPTEWDDATYYFELGENWIFGGMNPFEVIFLKTTMGLFLFEFDDVLPAAFQAYYDSAYIQHRDRILLELDGIANATQIPGPKFVFAHILAPHNPFVFGPNGEFIRRHTPFTLNMDTESDNWEEFVPGYIGQVRFMNMRVEEIVTRILEESESGAIIIIQGDHGIPTINPDDYKSAILNAIYLPEAGRDALYSNISSVNTFRLILDAYFGTNYGLLEDVSYYSTHKKFPFQFEIIRWDDFKCPAE
jgi:hypothetical protein